MASIPQLKVAIAELQQQGYALWLRGPPHSKTNVAHKTAGDFRSTEQSAVVAHDGSVRIELACEDGSTRVLRESVPVLAGEVVDAAVMRVGDAARVLHSRRSPERRELPCCSRCTSRQR